MNFGEKKPCKKCGFLCERRQLNNMLCIHCRMEENQSIFVKTILSGHSAKESKQTEKNVNDIAYKACCGMLKAMFESKTIDSNQYTDWLSKAKKKFEK